MRVLSALEPSHPWGLSWSHCSREVRVFTLVLQLCHHLQVQSLFLLLPGSGWGKWLLCAGFEDAWATQLCIQASCFQPRSSSPPTGVPGSPNPESPPFRGYSCRNSSFCLFCSAWAPPISTSMFPRTWVDNPRLLSTVFMFPNPVGF